jgi:hypothetical protein
MGLHGKMLDILTSMLEKSIRRVAVQGSLSESFITLIGLPQGAILSPLLYAIYINGLAEELNRLDLGVLVFGRRVSVLLYADDIVLVADSAPNLQAMLNCAQGYATKWRFRFNSSAGKSDVVIIEPSVDSQEQPAQFFLGSATMNIAGEYRYLGVEFGSPTSWKSYLERVCTCARIRMREVWYCARGRIPLDIATSVRLFKSLVRPILEYSAAIWGFHSAAERALKSMKRIHTDFGKCILYLQRQVPSEYIFRELGLQRPEERVDIAMLCLFGRLCQMGPERLAGHVFRGRCNQVDAGQARGSWCAHLKQLMAREPSFHSVWRLRSPLHNWQSRAWAACRDHYTVMSETTIANQSLGKLDVLSHLGPCSGALLRSSLRHKGARIRFKLRAGALPLLWTIAASQQGLDYLEPENRVCLLCFQRGQHGEVDNARHLLCVCPRFEELRNNCLVRIDLALGLATTPRLRMAMNDTEGCYSLFLGDSLFGELQPDIHRKVDKIICNFLRALWRQRETLWSAFTKEGNPWSLR